MSKNNSAIQINHGPVIGENTINSNRLIEYKAYLESSGRICPRPWYWSRFYSMFQPFYESYWLMQWWNTTDAEKKERFLAQLDYLTDNTMRFQDAYWYLNSIGDQNWHYTNK